MLAVCTHQCWPGPQLALLLPRTLVRCECLQDTAGWCWFYSWGLCLSVRCWLGGVIRWQTLHEEVQSSLIIACLNNKETIREECEIGSRLHWLAEGKRLCQINPWVFWQPRVGLLTLFSLLKAKEVSSVVS